MRTIAYITDVHLDEPFILLNGAHPRENWKKILDDVRNRQIKEVVFGGDIGEKISIPSFFQSLADFEWKITLGNHDKYSDVIEYFKEFSVDGSELFYAIDDDNFRYIFMDSSSDQISQNQLQWLSEQLVTDKKLILFIHHPVLEVDTYVDAKYPLKNRIDVISILHTSNKKCLLFCGHYHTEDERSNGNIKQFITPAASYQITKHTDSLRMDTSSFGYRIINIHDDGRIDSQVILFTHS
ncbi:MAG TPA: metallophosphoesterase [Flavisolibacter sp.]|nr:metallophosphoesterase [Flavisolibacter sp.]